MQPTRITSKASFSVAGIVCRCTMAQNTIPQLWDKFHEDVCAKLPAALSEGVAYGVCFYEEMESMGPDAQFSYLAGLEIPAGTPIPEGLHTREVPEATYAVFEHIGSLDTLQQTYEAIYRDWMPTSGYHRVPTDDFELYGPSFKYGEPDSVMEIWVPVEKH